MSQDGSNADKKSAQPDHAIPKALIGAVAAIVAVLIAGGPVLDTDCAPAPPRSLPPVVSGKSARSAFDSLSIGSLVTLGIGIIWGCGASLSLASATGGE